MKPLLCLSVLLAGCGSSLKGNWTCSVKDGQGTNARTVTIDFECRSDGSVTVNGQNCGATWSGNYITLPAIRTVFNGFPSGESDQFLMEMANEAVDDRGRTVDVQKHAKEVQVAFQKEQAEYKEALDKWQKTNPRPGPVPQQPGFKHALEGLKLRIVVKWVDNDHIDLGGGMKGQEKAQGFTPPTFAFIRKK